MAEIKFTWIVSPANRNPTKNIQPRAKYLFFLFLFGQNVLHTWFLECLVFSLRFLKEIVLVDLPKGPTLACVFVQDRESSPRQDWSNWGWLEEMVKTILAPLIAWIYWSLTRQDCPKGCSCYTGRSDGCNKQLSVYILSCRQRSVIALSGWGYPCYIKNTVTAAISR